MLASEVIKRLQELIEEYGDLEVYYFLLEDKLQSIEYDIDPMEVHIRGFILDT